MDSGNLIETLMASLKHWAPLGLTVSVVTPLVVGILLLPLKNSPLPLRKALTFLGFFIPFVGALTLCGIFSFCKDLGTGYAFVSNYRSIGADNLGLWLQFGLNGISLPLFTMASIVGLAAGLRAIWTKDVEMPTLYFAALLFIQTGLLGLFASMNIFAFYIFHEFALIPTFAAILIWGGQGKKTTAITMAVYLTLGAMISLAGLIWLYISTRSGGAFDFISLREFFAGENLLSETTENAIFALLLFGFGILVSLFPFHSWAPDTYTAAPTPVSMLHAGVLKKFGLYGLIQIGAAFLASGLDRWAGVIFVLAIGNIILIGLITMVQRDLKQMISYSSVMHMGPIFLGIAAFAFSGGDVTGIGAAVMLMFAHGLSVALLFHLSQSVADREGTMEMSKMGGLASKAPVLAGFFVAATLASLGLPGFANFWGELSVFVSLASLKPFWLIGLAVVSIIISAIYGLRAVAKVFYGKPNPEGLPSAEFEKISDITPSERIPAIILLVALFVVGFIPSLVTNNINYALAETFPASVEQDPCDTVPEGNISTITEVQSNSQD